MAAGAVSNARDPQHDVQWKWLLLTCWFLSAVWVFAFFLDVVGVGTRPWYGWWGSVPQPTSQGYVLRLGPPERGGAAAAAGIQPGDLIDFREQPLDTRIRLSGPLFTRPTAFLIHRGSRVLAVRIAGTTLWEGDVQWKASQIAAFLIPSVILLGCSLIIAVRRASSLEGRVFALILLLSLVPNLVVLPNAKLTFLLDTLSYVCSSVASLLFVNLAARFGIRFTWRRVLDFLAYVIISLGFLVWAAYANALVTLRTDPSAIQVIANLYLPEVVTIATMAVALAAVACSVPSVRSRAAWLLLPLPISGIASYAIALVSAGIDIWFAFIASTILSGLFSILGALAITYALLKRRVLDLGFVLSRALVVSIVSLMVVVAFVLLEWTLGSVLTGVSHATGLIANATLALVIGVSLNYLHKRVDESVDRILFRKRHEDERALLAFSKEAAYITEWDALLDATLEKVRRHTDARSASILIGVNGFYSPVRSFGDNTVVSVNENDEAILALKVWHKPIDPQHYDTVLHAALALPMLSRGKLYGVLILGEREGGEAYAPDEVEALSQLSNGVGSALEALSLTTDDSATLLAERIELAIASMGETLAAEIRALRTSSPA